MNTKQDNVKEKQVCPFCGTDEIFDHSEFGLPMHYNMRCKNWHMWKINLYEQKELANRNIIV